MKKYLFFLCLTILVVGSIILSSCVNKLESAVLNNISEIRENLYVGESADIYATFSSGVREQNYKVNGYSTENIQFGIVTFILKNDIDFETIPTYVLSIQNEKYEGVLEKNPFDGSYVADIKNKINEGLIKVKFISTELNAELDLNLISDKWKVDSAKALKLAIKECKKELQKDVENLEYLGESYVKIVNDEKIDKGKYFWYVSFVNRTGKSLSVILDTDTGKVLANKSTEK